MNLDRDWDLDLDLDLSIPRLGGSAIVGEDLDRDWDRDFGIRHLSDSKDRLESVEHLRIINDSEHTPGAGKSSRGFLVAPLTGFPSKAVKSSALSALTFCCACQRKMQFQRKQLVQKM